MCRKIYIEINCLQVIYLTLVLEIQQCFLGNIGVSTRVKILQLGIQIMDFITNKKSCKSKGSSCKVSGRKVQLVKYDTASMQCYQQCRGPPFEGLSSSYKLITEIRASSGTSPWKERLTGNEAVRREVLYIKLYENPMQRYSTRLQLLLQKVTSFRYVQCHICQSCMEVLPMLEYFTCQQAHMAMPWVAWCILKHLKQVPGHDKLEADPNLDEVILAKCYNGT